MPIKKLLRKLLLEVFGNKTILLIGISVVLLALFLPFQTAQAAWWDPSTWGDSIVKGLTIFIITILTIVPATIFFIVAGLVTWMLQTVLSIGVIPGAEGTPEFVQVGWNLSRNFVNILFILVLVFIGLATTLRIREYEIKNTLPKLILIALLVNFSGVLVGVIVDISNIIMNFFITATGQFGGNTFGNIYATGWSFITSLDDSTGLAQTFAMGVSYGFVMAIFYSISALIFFIIFLLFFVRTIMLWILVILAPLAFGAYILPATRGLFSEWWKQLIQWSIVGIPIAFFMYLANLIMKLDSNVWNSGPEEYLTEGVGFLGTIITSMMAPLVGLVLLFIGIQLSMRMAPAGAQAIISIGQKAGIGAAKFAGKRAFGTLRDRTPERIKKAGARLNASINPEWGSGQGGIGALAKRQAAQVMGYTRRSAGRVIKAGTSDADKRDATQAKAQAKEKDVIGNLGAFRDASTNAQRAGIMATMVEEKQIRDALDPDIVGENNVLQQEEVFGAYQKAIGMGDKKTQEGIERAFINKKDEQNPSRPFVDRLSEWVDETTKDAHDPNDKTTRGLDARDKNERGFITYSEKIIADATSADDVKQLPKGWWGNKDLMDSVHKFWGGNQIQQAATNFGRDFMNALENSKKDTDWYFEVVKTGSGKNALYRPRNTAIPQYFASTGAQSLGLSPLNGATQREEINIKVSIANTIAQTPKLGDGALLLQGIQSLGRELETATDDLRDAKNRGQNTTNIQNTIDDIKNKTIPQAEKDLDDWINTTSGITGTPEAESWNGLVDTIMGLKKKQPKVKREDINKYKTA